MTASKETLEGSCLCGKVRYRISGQPGRLSNCHCTDCRKTHGAAFATYLDIRRDQLTFLAGETELVKYQAQSGTWRAFCGTCGAVITCWVEKDPGMMEVAAGTFDTPFRQKIAYHGFVRSRVPWYEIQDDSPQYPAEAPD